VTGVAPDTDRATPSPSAASGDLVSGVDALVRLLELSQILDEREGLVTATMASGYPGSPLGTFDLVLDGFLSGTATGRPSEPARTDDRSRRIVHRPGLNEELAAAIVWGSQMGAAVPYSGVDGVTGVWYGKTPGLDRAGDALKHGNSMGAGPNGGVVLFCGDDPTAKSSTLACDSQHTFEDACIPVLFPGDQQSVVDLGVHAFRMSRFAGCWVGLKVVTAVADGIGTVDFSPDRQPRAAWPEVRIDGTPWRHVPLSTVGSNAIPDQELLVVEHRLTAARAYARHNRLDRTVGAGPGAGVGIICAGKTFFDLMQALSDLGAGEADLERLGVRVLRLGLTYPVVAETVTEFAASVDQVLVVEEKRPFVENQVRAILHEAGTATPVIGKRDASGRTLTPSVGELDAGSVAAILPRVLPELAPVRAHRPVRLPVVPVAARPPGFCSGCPHNRSTVVPAGALVGGGVGCHGIMYFEARHAGMKSLPPTPMGAEGVPWIGLAPFVEEPHLIQNLGDGTFSHSGILAIRASVAAASDITFKILYNSAVAMTGGQDVTGLMDVPAMTRVLEAEGVRRVVVCAEDPGHYGRRARWARGVEVVGRDRLPDRQEALRAVRGVTVIIYDQRCAAEARRLRRKGLLDEPPQRVVINEAVCEGCGDCSTKSNCLSVLPVPTEFGDKRQIHDLSCNRDYTCLEGDCPSFVTITPKHRRARWTSARTGSASAPAPARTGSASAPAPARTGAPSPAPAPPWPEGQLPMPPPARMDGQYGIYFTGIGGTGVVTANRILAGAARAAGYVVSGVDQTGLSQKAGAVVSHLHLADRAEHLGAAVISPGGADLYLSGDILQAASARHLERTEPGRTVAVVDRDLTPTAAMLQTGTGGPDRSTLEQAITERVGPDRVAFIDSKPIAEHLLGNHLLANVVLLGAAFQLGGLPMTWEQVDAAIAEVSPGGADDTRAAFQWGRWAVHDPAAVAGRLAAEGSGAAAPGGLLEPSPAAWGRAERLVAGRPLPAGRVERLTRRTAQVIDYQDADRAGRFLDLVERAAAVDGPDRAWALTDAVSEAWFKLLTYKDEYEVARLHLQADYAHAARQLGIDGPYTVKYHLHPPVLRRLGLSRKLPLGASYRAAFVVLSRMKRVRGTRLDPFGSDRDRRTERALIEEYEALMVEALAAGPAGGYPRLVELAASALEIKGYGPVKDAAVTRWRAAVAEWKGGDRGAALAPR
jgi:indolepyruvate ferredoxin oxidoreductase